VRELQEKPEVQALGAPEARTQPELVHSALVLQLKVDRCSSAPRGKKRRWRCKKGRWVLPGAAEGR
jgi:hypothetical protein